MCRFLPVNLRPINWIEELTSRAHTNRWKSRLNLPDIAQNANTRENDLFWGYGGVVWSAYEMTSLRFDTAVASCHSVHST